jgi:hypothetical protein
VSRVGSSPDRIGRRRFLARGAVGLLGASSLLDAAAQTRAPASSFVDVETTHGRVRGAQAEGLGTRPQAIRGCSIFATG